MPPEKRYQLNPFSFPPETNARFIMLIVGAAALILAGLVSFISDIGLKDWYAQSFTFTYQVLVPGSLTLQPDADANIVKLLVPQMVVIGINILAVAAGFSLALFIYRRHPQRVRTRYHLERLPEGERSILREKIEECCDQVGIYPVPEIELEKDTSRPVAQVYGFQGSYHLRLGHRMTLLLVKKPGEFKARIFHELAHIANGDVGRTYWTQAIWPPVIISILALAAIHVADLSIAYINRTIRGGFSQSWTTNLLLSMITVPLQAVILIILVRLLRASILRVREVYADARAVTWGAQKELVNIFRQNEENPKPVRRREILWQVHPDASERLESIHRPEELFDIPLDLPFLVGILVAMLIMGGKPLAVYLNNYLECVPVAVTYSFIKYSGEASWSPDTIRSVIQALVWLVDFFKVTLLGAAVFVLGAITTSTLGLQIERLAMVGLIADRKFRLPYNLSLVAPALLFTAGIQSAFIVLPLSAQSAASWGFGYSGWVRDYVWFAADVVSGYIPSAFVILWFWMSTVHILAVQVLGNHIGEQPPKTKLTLINLWMGVPIGIFMLAGILGQQSLMVDEYPLDTLYSLIGVALGICCLSLLLAGGVRLFRTPSKAHRCPNCQTAFRGSPAARYSCPNCGSPLALWLYSGPCDTTTA